MDDAPDPLLLSSPYLSPPGGLPERIARWRRLRFGLMMHWGLYSVAGGVWNGERIEGYNEQIMHRAKIAWPDYLTLTEGFTAAGWDPDGIAALATEAGTGYVVLTTKHHDGFCLWSTRLSPFHAAQATPAGRDLLAPLARACAARGLALGVYFSLIDWNYPGAAPMSDHNSDPLTPELEEYSLGQLRELLTGYGPLCEVWFDMGAPTPEQSRKLAAVVRELQPDCLSSGRLWNGCEDFLECGDNETPEFWFDGPWESSVTMFHETWGYRSWQERGDVAAKVREKVRDLAFVTARGGNHLLNIGPRGDGSIVEWEAEVLRGVGEWMRAHGEAVREGEPQPHLPLPFGYATARPGRLYLYVTGDQTELTVPGWQTSTPRARTLGTGVGLACRVEDGALRVSLPAAARDPHLTVVAVDHDGGPQPCVPARTLELGTGGGATTPLLHESSLPWHRLLGGDYYSQRRFVSGRQWLVRVAPGAGETWEMTARRPSGGAARGCRVQVGSDEYGFVLPTGDGPQEVTIGPIPLKAGVVHPLTLRPLAPGAELPDDDGLTLELRPASRPARPPSG